MKSRSEITTALEKTDFDILVIGGGINGLAIAWEAASRGLKSALVEAEDFGSKTSEGSFKLVHGGFRYLQQLDFTRLYESVREQKVLRSIAPHLVQPIGITVPCYGFGMRSKELIELALSFYETITPQRNRQTASNIPQLLNHSKISPVELLKLAPHLNPDDLRGGITFYDAQMYNPDRLTWAIAETALREGAIILNYARAIRVSLTSQSEQAAIEKVIIRDLVTHKDLEVKARLVINAAGPWVDSVMQLVRPGVSRPAENPIFSKGFQLLFPGSELPFVIALESRQFLESALLQRGGRSFFLQPWRGQTLLGTADVVTADDTFSVSEAEIESFLDEVYAIYPDRKLRLERVQHVFGGLRPVDQSARSKALRGENLVRAEVARDAKLIDHQGDLGVGNFYSVYGVKYTTARALAENVVDCSFRKLSLHSRPSRTSSLALVGAEYQSLESLKAELELASKNLHFTKQQIDRLCGDYGSKAIYIASMLDADRALSRVIDDRSGVMAGEIIYAAKHEAVVTLADLVMRRTPIGSFGYPGKSALEAIGQLAADSFNWNTSQTIEEINKIESKLRLSFK
ncbi:glycerol-3-phosphate dehydrogenase/oxidase [bacterium]|nr:glycerol-3-phosphate dehydrogenase/oxidase [bacterium]